MNKINKAFGRLLRDKREEFKLSQTEFAHNAGWPQTTVSRIEQGLRDITLPEMLSAARVLRCSVTGLLGELDGRTAGVMQTHTPAEQPYFTAGFSSAFASETAMIAQLALYGVRFIGVKTQPAFAAIPVEEVILAALRFANEPRIFEALPALTIKNAHRLHWDKLIYGAYAFHFQNRLGMIIAAALQLKNSAKGIDKKTWPVLQRVHDTLADGKLDRDEIVGPRPKTDEAFAFLLSRTPDWLRFWHGMGSADLKSFQRYLPQ